MIAAAAGARKSVWGKLSPVGDKGATWTGDSVGEIRGYGSFKKVLFMSVRVFFSVRNGGRAFNI